ncbi:MAG TPA: beta-L-arabinofuranosidase domain-containing protein [Lacipirellulaceae bacterium]
MQKVLAMILTAEFILHGTAGHCGEAAHDYPIRPVPAHQVHFDDGFWAPRIDVNRTATIPFSFQMCEETGRIENFKVAGGLSGGKWMGLAGYNDSDVFKIMEGAAYSLMTHSDEKLAAYLSELIDFVAAAQEDDGYLYTAWSARDRIGERQLTHCYPRDGQRWKWLKDSHELYNVGHMYEAAIAHWQATGESKFLDVAKKNANLIAETFGPGKLEIPPGHQEIEIGLVKLYRVTGDERYFDLAKVFVELRGRASDDRPELWGAYNQDHAPITEQKEPVGHAVRAMYYYAAVTDIAALSGDEQLVAAVNRLWDNVFTSKTYITGAIGSTSHGEAFGGEYDLPNETAYAETCANLATCLWNHRMFLLDGDAKYIDMLERALYNSVISGVAFDGKSFFYPNPLASTGNYSRSKWFDCACCPTNVCRFIPSVPGYVYATRDNVLYVNLFVAGSSEIEVSGRKIRVEQETAYPRDGRVAIKITPAETAQQFVLKVRVPGWARGNAFPTDLYRFAEPSEAHTLSINGKPYTAAVRDGYAAIDRQWQAGDMVVLELPMRVRRVVAHDKVVADRDRVALMRGPLVYCIEWPEVPGGKVSNLVLPDDSTLATKFDDDLLGGVQVVTGVARRIHKIAEAQSDGTAVEQPVTEELEFTAIPYYAWAHRGDGEMAVWLARTPAALQANRAEKPLQ